MADPAPGIYTYTISQSEADDTELGSSPRTGKGTLAKVESAKDRWKLVLDQGWTPMRQTELALGSTEDVKGMLTDGTLKSTAAAAAAGRRRTRRTRRKSRARKSRRSRK